jgi:hypothetical protein
LESLPIWSFCWNFAAIEFEVHKLRKSEGIAEAAPWGIQEKKIFRGPKWKSGKRIHPHESPVRGDCPRFRFSGNSWSALS